MLEESGRSRNTPTVFISYSWDSDKHRKWVSEFALFLRNAGANVLFDGDLKLGQQMPKFMEQSIAVADYVIIVCTENYKVKADGRIGGVGYENNIISGDLYSKSGLTDEKYIPVLRSGNWDTSMPFYMVGKLGVDCTNGVIDDATMADLITTFGLTVPHKEAMTHDKKAGDDIPDVIPGNTDDVEKDGNVRITGIILDEVTQPRMDGTRGSALYKVPFRLNKIPAAEWIQLFLEAWRLPPRFSTMHRPGIASVYGDTILLDGTTIDEVAEYHRDTLVLCVERANQQYQELCRSRDTAERERKRWEENQRQHVADIAKNINF